MVLLPPAAIRKHHLNPCMLMACRDEVEVTTILGSCVSVCLWDPSMGCGGINHFMLPFWNGDGLPTPKYGNVAIDKLIIKLLGLGCRKERLVAKWFGGASVLGDAMGIMQIGARNIAVAEELLANHGIPTVARDAGGRQGMKITFNTKSGLVLASRFNCRATQSQTENT